MRTGEKMRMQVGRRIAHRPRDAYERGTREIRDESVSVRS